MRRKFVWVVFLLAIVGGLLVGCKGKTAQVFNQQTKGTKAVPTKVDGAYAPSSGSPASVSNVYDTVYSGVYLPTQGQGVGDNRVALAFVGDIMVHEGQIRAAYDARTRGYSFQGYFAPVKQYLGSPDLTVGNLETTFSGAGQKYSGYPRFNAPESLAGVLREAGFDVLTTANNHALDRKDAGLLATLGVLEGQGLAHTGTYPNRDAAETPLVIEKKGIKFAFLAYTYGTNGMKLSPGSKCIVNYLDEARIINEMARARTQGAQVVVVSLHFGTEYQRTPGKREQQLVKKLAENGADIIIGTHPHVLQKVETVNAQYQGKPKQVLVAYSLGNFVSGYRTRYRDTGIILTVGVEKQSDGQIKLNYNYLPVWTHRYYQQGRTFYRVIPVQSGIAEFNKAGSSITKTDYNKLQQAWRDTSALLGNTGITLTK